MHLIRDTIDKCQAARPDHHHVCYLPHRRYKARLREAGWFIRNEFWASKTIAGREALMLMDRLPARSDRRVKCKLMWLSTARALEAAYQRRSEAIRRRARFEVIDARGRRPARTGLPDDRVGILLYDLAGES